MREKNQYQAKLENGTKGEVYRSNFTHRTAFTLWEDNEEGREVDAHSFTTYDILNTAVSWIDFHFAFATYLSRDSSFL